MKKTLEFNTSTNITRSIQTSDFFIADENDSW